MSQTPFIGTLEDARRLAAEVEPGVDVHAHVILGPQDTLRTLAGAVVGGYALLAEWGAEDPIGGLGEPEPQTLEVLASIAARGVRGGRNSYDAAAILVASVAQLLFSAPTSDAPQYRSDLRVQIQFATTTLLHFEALAVGLKVE